MERRKTATFTVGLLREGLIESLHEVHAVVCDERGRVLAAAGNADLLLFARSALKPFQALALLRAGVVPKEADLATLCSSHSGTIEHCRHVFKILWEANLTEQNLDCPIPVGAKSTLAHNCSGKHAGMLLLCRQQGWQLHDYWNLRHPAQQFIGQVTGELLALPPDELIPARDDCGVPTYQMSLTQLAWLYAKLSAGACPQLETIARAMSRYPERIAGADRFDTLLMQGAPHLVSKGGAEGIQCISHGGMGLALKVIDGSERAKYPVAIQIMVQLGWLDPAQAQVLIDRFGVLDPFKRLEVQGELDLG